jgi:release factor glutamine methyltransferase
VTDGVVERLRAAGCVFAEDEARLLGDREDLIARRCAGERLEHVLGWVEFGGLRLAIEPGVFVPRPQTVALAHAAADARPEIALDLFSGCGAIAAVIADRNPSARVVACELRVTDCLRRNVAEVHGSDVDDGVPVELEGRVDVLTANVPYVPTADLEYVPHDGEPNLALDGGADGLDWLRRVVDVAPRWLRPGGTLLVEAARHQLPSLPRSRYLSTPKAVSRGTENGIAVALVRR